MDDQSGRSRATLVAIADPDSLRWRHYHAAAKRLNVHGSIRLIPWCEVIERQGNIGDLLPNEPSRLRVESPGRDPALFAGLMQFGQANAGVTPTPWLGRQGWIGSPFWLHRGFGDVLSNVSQAVERNGRCQPTSNLSDTALLFDKNAVTRRLRQAEIPTPEAFQPESTIDLRYRLSEPKWNNAFVKLAYGSCGSGIVAIDASGGLATFRGMTTVRRIADRFYNTSDVQMVDGQELFRIMDFLVSEHATVQAAVEKARVHKDRFDVRVVVIGGRVAATIFRASPLPMTNLHLGGYRADPEACRQSIPTRAWAEGMEACRRAASLFDIAALGIDLAFEARTYRPSILEINAFGDFFPHWTDPQGRSIHELEIAFTDSVGIPAPVV